MLSSTRAAKFDAAVLLEPPEFDGASALPWFRTGELGDEIAATVV